jgi:hypothetical protein
MPTGLQHARPTRVRGRGRHRGAACRGRARAWRRWPGPALHGPWLRPGALLQRGPLSYRRKHRQDIGGRGWRAPPPLRAQSAAGRPPARDSRPPAGARTQAIRSSAPRPPQRRRPPPRTRPAGSVRARTPAACGTRPQTARHRRWGCCRFRRHCCLPARPPPLPRQRSRCCLRGARRAPAPRRSPPRAPRRPRPALAAGGRRGAGQPGQGGRGVRSGRPAAQRQRGCIRPTLRPWKRRAAPPGPPSHASISSRK